MSDKEQFIVCEVILQVENEGALRAEACNAARGHGLPLDQAQAYLDPNKQTLAQCALVLLAPRHAPGGTDVVGVQCELVDELFA
ncbi:hypothetical protein RKE25_22145 (plasmid) [Dyella sp. BiH032]|uniref:hypothetical protein n=1 Tax=Dyella sp. BiH032 TaxID=3075430 RepID=UPI00289318B2|nr:hypothetical protein [Dyella sp. BiH032]WNL48433.1 hypothetical protein RKE25_22145 [Dyella sp. BiH032]